MNFALGLDRVRLNTEEEDICSTKSEGRRENDICDEDDRDSVCQDRETSELVSTSTGLREPLCQLAFGSMVFELMVKAELVGLDIEVKTGDDGIDTGVGACLRSGNQISSSVSSSSFIISSGTVKTCLLASFSACIRAAQAL